MYKAESPCCGSSLIEWFAHLIVHALKAACVIFTAVHHLEGYRHRRLTISRSSL
jgi:hypothetical protein